MSQMMTLRVRCTFELDVEVPIDADPEFRIEENSCPGTGPVGSALESAIANGESTSTCWACPTGKNEIIAVNGLPVRAAAACAEGEDGYTPPTPEEIAEAEQREAARREELLSRRMTPARDALHQLRRDLARIVVAQDLGSSADPEGDGMQLITVYGKRVPEELSAMGALALLAGGSL